jgi:uncharacterized protein YgbK (DUF1537 family)
VDPVAQSAGVDEQVHQQAVLLHLPKPEPSVALDGPEARVLATILAKRAVQLAEQMQPGCLLLVGGDTTIAALDELGISRLTVVAELMPGIPLLEGLDKTGRIWPIITKAGNFGDESTLQRLTEFVYA